MVPHGGVRGPRPRTPSSRGGGPEKNGAQDAAGGPVLLPTWVNDLRESEARRERARDGVRGEGDGQERRRDDAGVEEGDRRARVHVAWARDPLRGRQAALQAAGSQGRHGYGQEGAARAARSPIPPSMPRGR